MRRDPTPTIQCIESWRSAVLDGSRRNAIDTTDFASSLRQISGRRVDILDKVLATQAFVDGVLRELMATPKMKELLSRGYRNTDRIRKAAGLG